MGLPCVDRLIYLSNPFIANLLITTSINSSFFFLLEIKVKKLLLHVPRPLCLLQHLHFLNLLKRYMSTFLILIKLLGIIVQH